MSRLAYRAVERCRTGFRWSDVRDAARLLDGSPSDIEAHVVERLRVTHGAPRLAREWLRRQPITTKDSFRKRVENEKARPTSRGMQWRGTSGSTGEPLRFPKQKEMLRQMDAAMWAVYSWHGIGPDSRQATFRAMPLRRRARAARLAADLLYARLRFNAFRISVEDSVAYFRSAQKFRATYAYGYPNLMLRFAEHCESAGLHGGELGIETVICTGELLVPETRTRLADFFSARVVNEYGCSESGILSVECELGSPHAVPWAALTEVQSGNDEELQRAGSAVVTDLYGENLPLLRYQLSDGVASGPANCECGRSLSILAPSGGRRSATIKLPDGREIFSSALAYSVPSQVVRFRARQLAIGTMKFEVVARRGCASGDVVEACRKAWGDVLDRCMRIDVELVNDIEPEPSGKQRYFIPLPESERNS